MSPDLASSTALFVCPRCSRPFVPERACEGCGWRPLSDGTVLDFLGTDPRTAEAAKVEAFYEKKPFPGYAPGDDASTLLDRSRRSPFLDALDKSLAPDATLVDCGCGTGQLAAFLALAAPRRTVVGLDGCRASLAAAARFKERVKISNLRHVRADLFALPLAPDAFDVVICRGVVHHTPEPWRATAEVAKRVKPGGFLVIGIYETLGRALHCARRGLSKLTGIRAVRFLDPVLRRKDLDPEKKEVWIADQYEHPLEKILAFPELLARVEAMGFEWVSSIPPAPPRDGVFEATPKPSSAGMFARRMGWCMRGLGDEDAGLVMLVACTGRASRAGVTLRLPLRVAAQDRA